MRRKSDLALLAAAGCFSFALAAVCLFVAVQDMSLTFALGVVVGAVALLVILVEPQFGLLLFIAFTYLRPGDRYPVLNQLRLSLVLALLTTLVWIAQYAIRRRPTLARHPALVCLAGLMAAAFLSRIGYSMKSGVQVAMEFSKVVVGCVLIANLMRSPNRLRWTCWLMVLCSAFNAFLAHQQVQAGLNEFGDRAAGIGVLSDPNDLALTLVIALPLALALWQSERGFYRRLLLVLASAALVTGVIESKSRGGALGLLMVLFLEGYERLPDRRVRALFSVVGVALSLVAMSALLAERGQTLGTVNDDASAYNRRGAWVAGWRMMLDKPFTGVGMWRFSECTDDYGPSWLEQRNLTAHNSVVLVAGELGVPGLSLWLGMLVFTWRSQRRIRRRLGDPGVTRTQAALGHALGRSLAGWCVCAFFLSQAYHLWLYLLVGLTVATQVGLEDSAAAHLEAA